MFLPYSAARQGTEMLELDVHITLDKEVVVSHDNCLERTTGHDMLVSETALADLPELKPALRLDFDRSKRIMNYEAQAFGKYASKYFDKFLYDICNTSIIFLHFLRNYLHVKRFEYNRYILYCICLPSPGHLTTGTDDRRIVLLKEVFEAFPHLPINIDIKIENDILMKKVRLKSVIGKNLEWLL